MKKAKHTEKLIRDIYTNKMRVTTNSTLDKRILANSINVLEKAKSIKPANSQPNILIIIARSRITQAATVLIVLSAICLLALSDKGELEQHKTTMPEIAMIPETPFELMSVISLNITFRDNDMDAVERQLDRAEKKTKPGLETRLTVEQLICELNGC